MIWIERHWLNKLTAMRGPGESYSDEVILQPVILEAADGAIVTRPCLAFPNT